MHLSDVATVDEAAENTKLGAWMNTTPAIILNVQRQPGANVDRRGGEHQGAAAVNCRAACPPRITVTPLTDRTTTIRASVSDVEFELGLSIALVVLVIFLFLRNLSRQR